jgi:hypothetical protein
LFQYYTYLLPGLTKPGKVGDFSPYFIEIALFPPKGYALDTLSVFVSPEM